MATELTTEQRLDRLENALSAYALVNYPNPSILVSDPANAPHGRVLLDFLLDVNDERR
jgi:hypothetical protein